MVGYDFTAKQILDMSRLEVGDLPSKDYKIQYDNGEVREVKSSLLWLDRYVWEMYKRFPNTPILPETSFDHVIGNGNYNGGVPERVMEATLAHIVEYNGLRSYRKKERLAFDVMNITNLMFNEVVQLSAKYVTLIDAVDCVNMISDPKILEILSRLENSPESVDNCNNEILAYSKSGIPQDAFARSNRCGASSDSQYVQLAGVRGFVTDMDRTVFSYGILRGFGNGLRTLYNMMAESRTAAKALAAAGSSIQKSEYASRRFQLLTMFVESAIDTDCGSQMYTDMLMTDKYLMNSEGIYYRTKDDPTLRCLKGTEKELVGTTIQIRTMWNCMLPNPHHVCIKCAGEVFNNFRENTNLGYLCSAYLMEKVTQRILSFKHVVRSIANSILKVEGKARKFFKGNDLNELEVRDDLDLDDLFIIISSKELDKLTESLSARRQDLNMSKIGNVRKVAIVSGDGSIKEDVALTAGDRTANITYEFLEHIKNSEFEVSDRGRYIIPLKGWDMDAPMFSVPLKEADVATFVSDVERLIEGTSDRTDSLDVHYFKLVDKILESSKCNLSTLQVFNYAISAQNPQDGNYRLGRDSSYRGIVSKDNIFKNRSLSPFLIGGDQSRMILNSPEEIFSTRNRQRSPIDIFYIPQQIIFGRRK